LWGKGKRLEIHNNPLNRTTIVRIQSEYLRQKILEKCVWYVGDTMFHTALWSKVRSLTAPPIKTLRIWAHLTGVPLDLRHQAGLSLVAGLVGEPKETDDFTKNMVSLTLSHVKVEVDLTQPLPSVVEFERQSGEVVEVSVHYPWVPPTCSHCKELGHIARNCLTYTPPAQDSEEDPPSATSKTAKKKQSKIYRPVNPSADNPTPSTQPPLNGSKGLLATPSVSVTTPPLLNPPPPPLNPLPLLPTQPTVPIAPLVPMDVVFSSPDPKLRPSLKRSRSSPTLSPPLSSNPNPFLKIMPQSSNLLFPLSITNPPTQSPINPPIPVPVSNPLLPTVASSFVTKDP
ncbi:unnamed protein product, partial [Brassica oleracea]